MAFDNNGVRAVGAKAYFYVGGTTTPYAVYTDAAETTPATDPVVSDGNGRWPTTFIPFGTYKEVIKTSGGKELSTADNIPNPEPTDPSDTVDPNDIFQVGDIILAGKNGTRAGFVRLNGRTIGNASSSATERANADTVDLFTYVYDNFANGQAAVSGGRGASAAADYAANKNIALPDLRNASPFGFGDMGNTDAGLMASAPVVSGSPILAGSIIGANTHTLTTGQVPSHNHAGSTATSNGAHTHTATTSSDGAHTHTGTSDGQSGTHTHNTNQPAHKNRSYSTPGFAGDTWGGTDTATASGNTSVDHTHTFTTASNGAHTHTLTTTSDGAHTHTLSIVSAGSDQPHNSVSRGVPFTFLMKL